MKTVIYADILTVTNMIINYFLLRAAAAITSSQFKAWRFLCASALGGIYSFIIFVDEMPVILDVAAKLVFSVLMVLISFGYVSARAFAKRFASFFLSNFAFAGIMLAGCTLFFKNTVIYKNGAVYFDFDILTLTVAAIVCYAVLAVISKLTQSKAPPKSIYGIELFANEKRTECKALFDTGNTLSDAFSGRPVVIIEKSTAEKLIPETAFDDSGSGDYTKVKGFRMIPYSTIKGAGALPAFPIEKINISGGDEIYTVNEVFAAVTDKKIISGAYSALLGPAVFDGISKREKVIK